MHELSIALQLIDIATEQAARHDARVLALHVKLGPLSGVVPDALVSAYELAREATPLADARLAIEETAIEMECQRCGGARPVVSLQQLRCCECDEPARQIISGRELELTALEIEE